MDTPPRNNKPRGQQRQRKAHSPAVHGDVPYHSDTGSARKRGPHRQQHQMDGSSEYAHNLPQAPTPVKAYAGGTFHNSPAASSLPLPRMFSRSVPSPAQTSKLQSQLDDDDNRGSPSPSPAQPAASQPPPFQREQSPLDVLFSAQRAEQARNTNNGSPLARPPTGPGSVPQPQRTPSYPRPGPPHRTSSARDMFMMEMDGETENEPSDTNSGQHVPFRDRLNAMRSPHPAATPPPAGQPQQHQQHLGDDEAIRRQKTADLKKLLLMDQINAKPNFASGLEQNQRPQHHQEAPREGHTGTVTYGYGQPHGYDPFNHNSRHPHRPYQQAPQAWQQQQHQQWPQHHHHHHHHPQQQKAAAEKQAERGQDPRAQAAQHAWPSDMQALEGNLRRVLKLDGGAPGSN